MLDGIKENVNIDAYEGSDKDDIFEAIRNLYRRGSWFLFNFVFRICILKISNFAGITILLIFSYIYFGHSNNIR